MTAAAIMAGLTARGVRFSSPAGRLRVEAPAGTLTDSDRAALSQHKAELLALLDEPADPWPFDPTAFIEATRRPWPPRSPLVASWSIPWRERWGRLANRRQEQGAPLWAAEHNAFADVLLERFLAGLDSLGQDDDPPPGTDPRRPALTPSRGRT